MNKIANKIFLLSACTLLLTACDNFLDVRPKAEKLERELFVNARGFEDAIYGVYGGLQSKELYGMNLTWGINEVLAQNLYCGSISGVALGKYNYTEDSGVRTMFKDTWTSAYQVIGYANNILDQLQSWNTTSLPLYNYYKGEMLAARAMLHFDLLRLFAPTEMSSTGIPYVREYSPTVKPFVTVEEDYRLIIADLTEAEQLLKDDENIIAYPHRNNNYEKFLNYRETHLNLFAVRALLARVYWMKGDLVHAAQYAEQVIASGAFPLADENEIKDYVAGVLSPKETLFGIYSTSYVATVKSYLYEHTSFFSYNPYYNGSGSGSTYLEPFTEVYKMDINNTEQDRRLDHFKQTTGIAFLLKMVDYYTIEGQTRPNGNSLIKGISLLHSAELYLIAADALLITQYNKALQYYDKEVQSRGLASLEKQGKTLTADMIYHEYRKEMFGEGQAWYNMKRLKRDIVSNMESRTIPASNTVYVIPIPQEEYEYRS